MTESFEQPDVEMGAVLNATQLLEIGERDFSEEDYFQVLSCPELVDNKHPYGVAINKRGSLASRTDIKLINNKPNHSGKVPFKCSFCEKAFNHRSHLKDHERIHTGQRLFKCTFCAKAFIQSSNLKTHERIHTGERPFKCTFCVKAFFHSSNLKTHERIHNGERRFKCTFCGKAFIRLSHLKQHEITHTKERPLVVV